MHKRSYSWSNPTSIASTIAGAAGFLRRRAQSFYGSYSQNSQMARSKFRIRSRGRIGTRTKRRRFMRRRGGVKRRITRIWKFMRRKGLRSVETKYAQAVGTSEAGWATNPSNSWAIGTLRELTAGGANNAVNFGSYRLHPTNISLGSAVNGRIGNKIFVKDFKFRAMVEANLSTAAPREQYMRFLVVRVKSAQGIGQTATYTEGTYAPYVKQLFDMFEDDDPVDKPISFSGKLGFINTWKFYDNRLRDDFTILKNKVIKISNEEGADFEKKLVKFNVRINQPCWWKAGEAQDGHIYVYWYVDSVKQDGSVVGNENIRPIINFTWRLTYTDV